MPNTYKVEAVVGEEDWEGNFGPMRSYELELTGIDGTVSINQKPTSPPPAPGDAIQGTISEGQYGKKLKREWGQHGGGGGNGGSQQSFSPSREARIERMAHHKVAVAALDQAFTAGIFKATDVKDIEQLVNVIGKISDLLAEDMPS